MENTHEPLISQEVWDAVQRMDNHPARGRSGKSGTVSLFGGLLRCMDCGSSMRYMRDYRKKVSDKEPEYKAYVCNRYASGGKNACSSHYINQKVLTQIVLTDIRCKAIWAQNSREKLREKILAQKESAGREKLKTLQAELSAIDRRLPELDRLVQSDQTVNMGQQPDITVLHQIIAVILVPCQSGRLAPDHRTVIAVQYAGQLPLLLRQAFCHSIFHRHSHYTSLPCESTR